MPDAIPVALCADKNIVDGVHVTLYSMLESSESPLTIYFLNKGYSGEDLDSIRRTLAPFEGRYRLEPIPFDDSIFKGIRGLFGNLYTFVRLVLPQIVDEPRILYLDSDLIVTRDVTELFHKDLQGHVIAAPSYLLIRQMPDREFLRARGLNTNAPCFNAGVLVMDLVQWRKRDMTDQCLAFARKYARELPVADQTVLNYFFYRDFLRLDRTYSYSLYPEAPPILHTERGKTYHFIRSPKPWDFLGEIFHRNHPLFARWLEKTDRRGTGPLGRVSVRSVRRALRSWKAYARSLRQRLRGEVLLKVCS
jgi:lipopolysaccharide biosynthesis glycosyltransferase